MNVSSQQLSRTATLEGFVAKAYPDGYSGNTQMFSVGYGHQIQAYEKTLLTKTLTKAEALNMLHADMQTVVNYVNTHAKRTINQNQFDALCDFGFNCGVGALGLVITDLNNNGFQGIPAHIKQYNKSRNTAGVLAINNTLVSRRAEEAAVFTGTYTSPIIIFAVFGIVLFLYYIYFSDGQKIDIFS